MWGVKIIYHDCDLFSLPLMLLVFASCILRLSESTHIYSLYVVLASYCCYTHDHELNCYKLHKYLSVRGVRGSKYFSLGWNPVSTGLCFFVKALGEILFSCLFHLLESAHIPWLIVPLSSSRPAMVDEVSITSNLSDNASSILHFLWFTCIMLHLHWIMQDNLLSSTPLP